MLTVQSKLPINYAHIHSHLNYAMLVWGSMLLKNKLEKLFKVQKRMYEVHVKCCQNSTYQPNIQKIKNIKVYFNDRFRMIQIRIQNI